VQVVDRNNRDRVTTGHYIVQRGDTLWSIAFRFGWDWKELAQRNGIAPPHVIHPGQQIRFDGRAPRNVAAAPAPKVSTPRTTAPVVTTPVPIPPPITRAPQAPPPASTPIKRVTRSASGWAWPANGQIIGRFSSNGSLNKGIDIAGELGQPVLAASDGTVVYADTYVSAYGHNRRLLVQEGQQVKAGQSIAEMGSTGTDRVKLHFEIRRQGKPGDPLQYLPKR